MLKGPPLLTPLRIEQPLERGLSRPDGAPALADPSGSLSWRELDAASAALAAAYRARGLGRGERLATFLPNQLGLMVSYLACLRAGLVIGVADAENGENVCAFVTLRPGMAAPSEADLIAHAAARVGVRAPQEVHVLAAMPLNATGKVDRRALLQQHTRY